MEDELAKLCHEYVSNDHKECLLITSLSETALHAQTGVSRETVVLFTQILASVMLTVCWPILACVHAFTHIVQCILYVQPGYEGSTRA